MFGVVPVVILAALPLWMAIPIDWNRKLVDLLSPFRSAIRAILDPNSLMNLRPCCPQAPIVSGSCKLLDMWTGTYIVEKVACYEFYSFYYYTRGIKLRISIMDPWTPKFLGELSLWKRCSILQTLRNGRLLCRLMTPAVKSQPPGRKLHHPALAFAVFRHTIYHCFKWNQNEPSDHVRLNFLYAPAWYDARRTFW